MRNRLITSAMIAVLVLSACSGDDESAADEPTTTPGLSAAEREWCSFDAEGIEDESRWVLIYDAGRLLGINMENVNADASDLRVGFEAEGMSPNEAVAAVSAALFDNEDFVDACREAYSINN